MRKAAAYGFEIVGFAVIVYALWLLSPSLAIGVSGMILTLAGFAIGGGDE